MADEANVKEPRCYYYANSNLQDALEYWKKVLHLQNWCIKAILTGENLEVDGRAVHGRNTTEYLKCESFIFLSRRLLPLRWEMNGGSPNLRKQLIANKWYICYNQTLEVIQ